MTPGFVLPKTQPSTTRSPHIHCTLSKSSKQPQRKLRKHSAQKVSLGSEAKIHWRPKAATKLLPSPTLFLPKPPICPKKTTGISNYHYKPPFLSHFSPPTNMQQAQTNITPTPHNIPSLQLRLTNTPLLPPKKKPQLRSTLKNLNFHPAISGRFCSDKVFLQFFFTLTPPPDPVKKPHSNET